VPATGFAAPVCTLKRTTWVAASERLARNSIETSTFSGSAGSAWTRRMVEVVERPCSASRTAKSRTLLAS
jgi:hypothetical protein